MPQASEDGQALQSGEQQGSQINRIALHSSLCDAQTRSNWFAVYTTSRHEKRVAEHFSHRQIEHFLPLYQSVRKWKDGSKVTLQLPLFPGYIFVHIRRTERVRVLGVPGALAVVAGTGGEPVPLPDSAIDALRCGLDLRGAEPHPLLTVGQRVRIRSGAFTGMDGIVVKKKSSCRVVLTMEQIMQSISVEVDEGDLEPLPDAEASMPGHSIL